MSKPKFRVGQVVVVRDGHMNEGTYHKVLGFREGKDSIQVMFEDLSEAAIFALRPLTAREKGQRKKR